MLDIERMRKEMINRSLLGSYCEEYTYFYDSRTIKFEKSGYLIGTDPNSRITADNDLDNRSYNFDNVKNYCRINYSIDVKKNDEEVAHLGDTIIRILDYVQIKAVPFKEYIPDKTKYIGSADRSKSYCRGLYFYIENVISSVSSTEDNTITDYRSFLDFIVAVNQECYIYIIQSPDGTLPTILVSKDRIGDFNLNDINDYIFKGNVGDNSIYNSYFHPHKYNIVKRTSYDQAVYSSPDAPLHDLKFKEAINVFTTSDINTADVVNYYSESDKLTAVKKDNNIVVELDKYKIAEYSRWEKANYTDIELIKYMADIDVFNSMHEVKEEISVNELIKRYPNVKTILPDFPIQDRDENILLHIETDDEYEVYTFEYYATNFTNIVIRVIDNTIEVSYILNDDERMYYGVYRNGYKLDSLISKGENNDDIYYFTSTNNRTIDYSRDMSLITYKANAWINLDKSDTIVNSNLPIVGKFTKYNILGIPEKL